jgi:hypothetical protein
MAAQEMIVHRAAMQTPLAIEKALIENDLSALSTEGRLSYYKQVCESVGLNPLTQPLGYLKLNGKTVLYAKKDATDQLRKIHGVSVTKIENQRIEDVYVVTAYGADRDGRTDSATGAVTIAAMKGDNLANALMKAETKAKRRLTLSICGLGMLDETEIETVKGAMPVNDEPTEDLSAPITEQKEKNGVIWWNLNGAVVLFCDEKTTTAEYSRLMDQVGKTATVKAWFRREHEGKKVYELAEVISIVSPTSPQQPETTKPEFNTEAGTFKGKVVSVTPQKRLDKEFLTVMTNHRLKPIDKLNVSFTCFHKSLTSALTDCVDRECVLKLKENKGYWNVEDVLEIEGIPYKDGKVAD